MTSEHLSLHDLLNKKIKSNYEILHIANHSPIGGLEIERKDVLVRVRSSKRILSFGLSGANLNHPIDRYYLELPDLLFLIKTRLSQKQELNTTTIFVYGLNTVNKFLVLPLTNIYDDGQLCCDKLRTKIVVKSQYETCLVKHIESQINCFFNDIFTYDVTQSVDRYVDSTCEETFWIDRYKRFWESWQYKTKHNQKFKFSKMDRAFVGHIKDYLTQTLNLEN